MEDHTNPTTILQLSLQGPCRGQPSARRTAQTQQPGSSAGPSSLLAPIRDLSAPEAAGSLPSVRAPRTRSEHRASLEHVKHPSDNEKAAAPGSARHRSTRRRPRHDAIEEGGAGPLSPDSDDITADASLKRSASAAPKRKLKESPDSPALDQNCKAPTKVPRLGGLRGRSRAQEILDLTGMGDSMNSPPRVDDTLGGAQGEPEKAPHGTFSCAICLDEHSMDDCYIASMGGYRMCRNAARAVVLGAVRTCSFPMLCPICQAKSEPRCIPCSKREGALAAAQEAGRAQDVLSGPSAWCCTLDADVLLLLTVEEEEQYLERSLKAAANSCPDLKSCPQPDCKGMAVAGAEDESPALVCNACGHEWCGKCSVEWHSNKSCDDYQREVGQKEAEKGLEEYRKNNRIVKCPSCGHGTEKMYGCDRLTCAGCNMPFCWGCGQKLPHTSICHPGSTAGNHAAGPGGPAQGGPAQGIPAVPGPAQPAQQGAPWPWLWPRAFGLGTVPVLPSGVGAPPAAAPVPPAPASPRARPLATAPPPRAAITPPLAGPLAIAPPPRAAPAPPRGRRHATAPPPRAASLAIAPPRAKPAARGRGRGGRPARGHGQR